MFFNNEFFDKNITKLVNIIIPRICLAKIAIIKMKGIKGEDEFRGEMRASRVYCAGSKRHDAESPFGPKKNSLCILKIRKPKYTSPTSNFCESRSQPVLAERLKNG